MVEPNEHALDTNPSQQLIQIFLCGDVMTGRGIDQILAHPSLPHLYEPYVRDAREYIALAESLHGPIPRPVDDLYIWGDALAELARHSPDIRVVNLETSITTSEDHWPDKDIHYRMHPANIGCLTAAKIDCCVLANNHVLDWGYTGLVETLATLRAAGIATAGAGENLSQAQRPAILQAPGKGRVLVFGFGDESSGIPREWAATDHQPGVNLLPDLSMSTVRNIGQRVRAIKRTGDVVIASIHWGSNWGYHIPAQHRTFAHALIDQADVDIVHGHSSHHPRGIEVHRNKLVLYGCGDFLNDYEGIQGFEHFRSDLTIMYFVTMDPSDKGLRSLQMTPMQVRKFSEHRASPQDTRWLCDLLTREGKQFGTSTVLQPDGTLSLRWQPTTERQLP